MLVLNYVVVFFVFVLFRLSYVDHHFGRAVIMFGIPYVYTQSRILKVIIFSCNLY